MKIRLLGMVAVAFLIVAAPATAKVKNGNFEQGNFSHWHKKTSNEDNRWRLYTKRSRTVLDPIVPRGIMAPVKLPKPLGRYSPVIEVDGEGHSVLYRKLKVPSNAKRLKLKAFWNNLATQWSFGGKFKPLQDGNQYFSIDLLKRRANPESTDIKDVLRNVFAPDIDPITTVSAGPSARKTRYKSGWKSYGTDVKSLRGKKVILRLVETDTQFYQYVGIDNVRFK